MLLKRVRLSKPALLLSGITIFILLAVLVGWLTSPTSRQAQLNYDLACAIEANDIQKALLVLQAGANVNAHDFDHHPPWKLYTLLPGSETPHRTAALYYYSMWPWDGGRMYDPPNKRELLQFLLDHGADPNTFDDMENTPLIMAARARQFDSVQLLLKHGANANTRPEFGETALHWAAHNGDVETIRLLLPRTSDINTADFSGFTPLMLAVMRQHPQCVQVLLENHADVNLEYERNERGETALDLTRANGNQQMAAILRKAGAKTGKELDAEASPFKR
jgi:hypothetical protein